MAESYGQVSLGELLPPAEGNGAMITLLMDLGVVPQLDSLRPLGL